MHLPKNLVVLLTSTLLICFTSQSSTAFKLYYTPRPKDYLAESYFPTGKGITTLDVVNPETASLTHPFGLYDSKPYIYSIKRGGTEGFLNDLNIYTTQEYGGWTFEKGNELQGSFNVRRLFACGIGGDGLIFTLPTVCGTSRGATSTFGIGATLELDYRPSKNKKTRDPKPSANNLFWIQRVITNYPPDFPGLHQSYIDNRTKQSNGTYLNAIYPYFGRGNSIRSEPKTDYGYFGDRPYRLTLLDRNYYWIGELYLAKAETRQNRSPKVTIYNGVRWGWRYQYIPNNDSCPAKSSKCSPPPPPCNGNSGGGGCNKTTATNYVNYQDEISPFDIDNINELEDGYLSFLDFDEIAWNSDEEDYWYDDNEYADWNEDYSESPTSVPESTSTLGLLLLSAFVFIKSLTITKD
ncbi:MAG: hypothetical protein EAZ87_08340 [Nostocales cyanobacterium]|nr:MAG: hypothetical protein EAZ87_08340 [Nostocales cyanobacterium]